VRLDLAQYQTDHDILIELRTEMRLLRETIRSSADGTQTKLDDHEKRLRFIERWMWIAIGIIGPAQFTLTLLSNNGFHF
jgi:hypothetical protein